MSATPVQSAALGDLRVRIDQLDAQIIALLNERARVAEAVGALKRREGSPLFRPDRVAQVIAKVQQANPGPLKDQHVAAIWREITSACLALEAPVTVAVLGPQGTFCEQAALEYFGSGVQLAYCNSFDEVFHATVAGTAQFGVAGVENSTEGAVARTLDLLRSTPTHIVGEVSLVVRHNLLTQARSFDDVTAVLAHPQALMQCHGWLSEHLPRAERRPVSSNAEGARLAAGDPAWAALASERAAAQFGLPVAARAIQDQAHNRTRFAVICLPQTLPLPPATGNDRTSLVVAVPNKAGSLYDLLAPLKAHGVSMSRLESRPAKSGQWEYYFYIDITGHAAEPQVARALAELEAQCAFYKVLGAYAQAQDV
jgi:chorismate mutase/prephenate dehydratase